MNIANKLTVLRIILIPFFLVVFYIPSLIESYLTVGNYTISWAHVIAFIIFAAAAFTDWLDGHLARKLNLISDFGKFMDPLADKMLTTAAFLIFIDLGLIPSWIVFVVLTREFIVSGVRLNAAAKGTVIAAGWSGKFKTVLQFFLILILLVYPEVNIFTQLFAYAMTIATVYSGAEYVVQNKDVIF